MKKGKEMEKNGNEFDDVNSGNLFKIDLFSKS
jgi:hypothetical protein